LDPLLEATYRAEQSHFWFRGFRQFIRPLLAEATAGVGEPVLLDCGCGTGANLTMLGRFGRVFGFDLSWTGVQYARRFGHSGTVAASITHIPFPASSFHVVTAFDVLQVLPDPAEAMAIAEMHRVLRPGGTLVVNVAALQILRGDHAVLGGEVRRYRPGRLRQALVDGGFTIRRQTYTNATLFPIMLAARTVQRLRGLKAAGEAVTDILVPPAPLNTLLTWLVTAEAQALRRINMPIGSSILCVARKDGL
jgi:SAM-dependent methyltransferase